MANYSFSNLSGMEFEILCRDLLQRILGLPLESFGAGADKGIDLRYSGIDNIIVQCKNYKNFASLYQNLKLEVPKVLLLSPERYIITTSTSLLPAQKDKIFKLFSPYIRSYSDILGKEDLNNALAQNKDIEKANYKLWLSSVTILEHIFHTKTVNDSAFVLDDIKEKLKYYVQNDSFTEASNILERDHYVVISGIPGIGKTTLAEILSFMLLGTQQAEFINVSNSADEAIALYKEDAFQVFLMDDFLGSTFLDNTFQRNEDKQLLRLIKQVKKSDNKRLILTTREYILNQAMLKFETLAEYNFSKCIVDLSKYTVDIRAQILYNHLYFNNVPAKYINNLITEKILFKIINHRNYSPRIIDYITKNDNWQNYTSQEFGLALISYFNNPLKIWEAPFENHISDSSRGLLYSLLLAGEAATEEHLFLQIQSFDAICNPKNANSIDKVLFKKSLKELDNSFTQTNRPFGELTINFQNPSIKDFLVNNADSDEALKEKLISSAIFLKPLINLFIGKTNLFEPTRLSLNKNLKQHLISKIYADFDNIGYNSNVSANKYKCHDNGTLNKLVLLYDTFLPATDTKLYRFIGKKFSNILYCPRLERSDIANYTKFLILYFDNYSDINLQEILTDFIELLDRDDDLESIVQIKHHFPDQFEQFELENEDLYKSIFPHVIQDICNSVNTRDNYDVQQAIGRLIEIEEEFGIDTIDERTNLSEMFNKYADYEFERDLKAIKIANTHQPVFKTNPSSNKPQHARIQDLFGSMPDDYS